MKAEYINPFLQATKNAFQTMLECPLERGQVGLLDPAQKSFDICGVIGLSGKAIGTVVLNLSTDVALKATSKLLMADATEVNSDVFDAVGELTNMVAGGAKAQLEQLELSISLPTVISGSSHEIHFPSNVTPISIPFSSPWGPLSVDVGLASHESA